MLLSGLSWGEVLSWLIGLLVLYEVSVYVIFTYGKKLVGPSKKGFELDDGSGEESTEARIAQIDEMDEASYENIEFHDVGAEAYSEVQPEDEPVDEPRQETERAEPQVGEDGMYHSEMPDVDGGQETAEAKETQTEDEDDDDNDHLPTNVETESASDEVDEVKHNFELAEEDVFFSEEEIREMGHGLFSPENVIEADVLGDGDGANTRNVRNLAPELVETGDGIENKGKKRFTFEDSEPLPPLDYNSLKEDLNKNRSLSTQYVAQLQDREDKSEGSDRYEENSDDETPDQEGPDD